MHRAQYSIVVLLFLLLSGSWAKAQTCAELKSAALQLGEEKDMALRVHEDLLKERSYRVGRARQLSITIPEAVLSPLPHLDPDEPKYHDERGQCVNGTSSWGTVKDLREYKLDSLELENQGILSRIQLLQAAIDESIYTPPAPPDDLPVAPSRMLAGSREIFQGKTYAYSEFDPAEADLRITPRGRSTGYGFEELRLALQEQGNTLLLAMNAGMYESTKAPVGLLVANGQLRSPLNIREGRGNFYMQPNGVFGVYQNGTPFILTTKTYQERAIPSQQLRLATQSGPLMLLNERINPKFTQGSSNLNFRNAVGITSDGKVILAISEQRVNFYEFSEFLIELGCVDALYLDGVVSRFYYPPLHRTHDLYDSQHLGPILYIVE